MLGRRKMRRSSDRDRRHDEEVMKEFSNDAVQYSTVQYSTVQYSTVQYSTVQYSTVQYVTSYSLTHTVIYESHDLNLSSITTEGW